MTPAFVYQLAITQLSEPATTQPKLRGLAGETESAIDVATSFLDAVSSDTSSALYAVQAALQQENQCINILDN